MRTNLYKRVLGKWTLVGASALLSNSLIACSEDRGVSGGTSVDAGIVALAGKNITGAAQKGPLVKGSRVTLRETSAEGNLVPTGREFETTIIGDRGEFKYDSLDLESQYVLLSAEGYYTHDSEVSYYDDDRDEEDRSRSECPMRLDAVTNLAKRDFSNINLLTHFEYKRVLELVKSGESFAAAKRQASSEVLGAFGVNVEVSAAEDLNIFNTSDADRTLYNLSLLLDSRYLWDPWDGEGDSMDEWEHWMLIENINCSNLQKFIDGFADDFADDGVLNDSIMRHIVSVAYYEAIDNSEMEYTSERDMLWKESVDEGSYDILLDKKKKYEFSKLLFLKYMDVELCTEDLWGEYRQFSKPIGDFVPSDSEPGYLLCNGFYWEIKTKGYIDSLKMKIPHGSGTMTDPRSGYEYKTVSFEFGGKTYEWMAEDFKCENYMDHPANRNRGTDNVCSWTTAMQINHKYMSKPVESGVIDSVHQGICPDGWHVSNTKDWEALIAYVGGVNNLLDESWRTDMYVAYGKSLMGVFYNRFDFNLEPMDKRYLELYYHTYAHESFARNMSAELDSLWEYYYPEGSSEDYGISYYLENYENNRNIKNTTIEISIGYSRATTAPREEARVRCVKN